MRIAKAQKVVLLAKNPVDPARNRRAIVNASIVAHLSVASKRPKDVKPSYRYKKPANVQTNVKGN